MRYFFDYATPSLNKMQLTKSCIPLFPRKRDLRITKNYRGITLTTIGAKVYNDLLPNLKLRKFWGKIKTVDGEIDSRLHRFWQSVESSCKKSRGNTFICRFFPGILFHRQRKDGTNTTSIWFSQRKCYRLLRHCRWSFVRTYMNIIFIYMLRRLCTPNVDKSNERKWFHI